MTIRRTSTCIPSSSCSSDCSSATGWHALIADAASLEVRNGALWANGTAIDLVYNRVTDFYFDDERHAALRQAYENDLAVITPNPATHARWADKRLLAWLRDESLLSSAGLDESDRAHCCGRFPRPRSSRPTRPTSSGDAARNSSSSRWMATAARPRIEATS